MKTFAERNPIVIAVVGLLTLALALTATFFAEDLPVIGGGTTYRAVFKESGGLREGNEVRVAGVKVGEVTDITLEGRTVVVAFRVGDAWIGDRSTADIKIKTMLGQKFLSIDPLGDHELDPDRAIPVERTTEPFDVTDALSGLSDTIGEIDTDQMAQSFEALSTAFADTPAEVRGTVEGLSRLARVISSRDDELDTLLDNTAQVSGLLADRRDEIGKLITDGSKLLEELAGRREAIGSMLRGTRDLARQLDGLVSDNEATLRPALTELDRVAGILDQHQDDLDKAARMLGPYYRLLASSLGNGPWVDTYLCGLFDESGAPELDAQAPRDCQPRGEGR
ncbi:MCE family protein [Nocardioides plantarum]|uniref:MCE family protein n=1 Tax=Nocardioides plantarum TaxID=29299 RepID=A0ABV5KEG4_9ACTN|nr:MCE family protein [Nocardioides plantarum]